MAWDCQKQRYMPYKYRARHTLSGPSVTYGTPYFISTRVIIKGLSQAKVANVSVPKLCSQGSHMGKWLVCSTGMRRVSGSNRTSVKKIIS